MSWRKLHRLRCYASAVSAFEIAVVTAVAAFALWPGLAERFTEWWRRP